MPSVRAPHVRQAAKIRHSASRNFDSKTHDAFDANPSHELLRKIKSSIWRWSLNDKSWNEVVDAYAAIRSFDLGIEGLEVTLDYTNGYNEQWMGKHSSKPLDGVFEIGRTSGRERGGQYV